MGRPKSAKVVRDKIEISENISLNNSGPKIKSNTEAKASLKKDKEVAINILLFVLSNDSFFVKEALLKINI